MKRKSQVIDTDSYNGMQKLARMVGEAAAWMVMRNQKNATLTDCRSGRRVRLVWQSTSELLAVTL